jgi:hypothetical protein
MVMVSAKLARSAPSPQTSCRTWSFFRFVHNTQHATPTQALARIAQAIVMALVSKPELLARC